MDHFREQDLTTDDVLEDPRTTGFVWLPLALIQKAPWNYKEDDDHRQQALQNKIQEYGGIVNMVVRWLPSADPRVEGKPVFEACDGNHRVDAYRAEGYEKVKCYNAGEISVPAAKRIATDLNEGDFEADPLALAETLRDIEEEFGREDLLHTSAFTESEVENYLDMLDFDWDFDEDDDFDEQDDPGGDDEDEWESFDVIIPDEAFGVWQEAKENIEDRLEEMGHDLHGDPGIRRGQVIEYLAAEYLAGDADMGDAVEDEAFQTEDESPF